MKLIPFLMLFLLLGKGCKDETPNIKNAEITYTAHSRGFYREVVVKDKRVVVMNHAHSGSNSQSVNSTSEPIDDETWKAMKTAFADLSPEDMETLKAPSNKRMYDGAAIAKLKVVYKGKTYESIDFDHGTPPAEIEKMTDLMAGFVNREE